MFRVEVHPDVYTELEHSRAWYEERAKNLGKEKGIHRYLVHRFPYGVIYRIDNRVVQILAVMHLRRRPTYWRERIQYWNSGQAEQPTTT